MTPPSEWRRIFRERGLVWTQHNLITPAAEALVEAETRRMERSGAARKTAEKAEAFVARGAIPSVELRPSKLPIGEGLFAVDGIAAGELIGEYTGLVLPIDDVEERGAYAYEAWPGSPLAIDACTAGNHTRFVNHASDPNLDVSQCFVAGSWRVLLTARRTIAAGDELFFDYGHTYWRRRRMLET
jgi:hypothetical protein